VQAGGVHSFYAFGSSKAKCCGRSLCFFALYTSVFRAAGKELFHPYTPVSVSLAKYVGVWPGVESTGGGQGAACCLRRQASSVARRSVGRPDPTAVLLPAAATHRC